MSNEHALAYGDEHPIAKAIRDAIGVGDFERVQITLPKFERDDGRMVANPPPADFRAWDALREVPTPWLKDLGLGLWDVDDGVEIWLYPHEWYNFIPEGYEVTDINGSKELFARGKTDDDKRFGMLAFGFSRKLEPKP